MIFNTPGIVIVAIGFGIAYGIGAIFGTAAEKPMMLIAGLLIAAIDMAYRLISDEGHWLTPKAGGSLFFVPAWVIGVIWATIGMQGL